jgi:hypothetical protein
VNEPCKQIQDWQRAGYRALLWQTAKEALLKTYLPLDLELRSVLESVVRQCEAHQKEAVERVESMKLAVVNEHAMALRKNRRINE